MKNKNRRLLWGGGQGSGGSGGGFGSGFHKNKTMINNKQIAKDLNEQILRSEQGHYQDTSFEEHGPL